MNKIFTILLLILYSSIYSQTANMIPELKNFIGKTIEDVNTFYKTKPTIVEDNFGDSDVTYKIKAYGADRELTFKTKDGKIESIITGDTSSNFKLFFKNIAEQIEKTATSEIFINVRRRINSDNTYFKSVNELIEVLKDRYDLRYYTGEVKDYPHGLWVFIVDDCTVLEITKGKLK
ncbi:hypothetical protein [Elizabethkingia ursingii]|uniref:hypothetical protein n=1 Tax=Elizabethkingia ursingii TaxID=1756150 RepID=UPI0020123CC5|nr:hypothetical protein [Elizabethkingia ursingii]MCL1671767.1 hypothetical protein [Elizabethkingia ursingii]